MTLTIFDPLTGKTARDAWRQQGGRAALGQVFEPAPERL